MSYTVDDFIKLCAGIAPAWKPAHELYADYLVWCNPYAENVDGIAETAIHATKFPRSLPTELQGTSYELFCKHMIGRFGGCWNREGAETTDQHRAYPRGTLGIYAILTDEGAASIYKQDEIPPVEECA